MSQDLLERATKALREQGGAEPPVDRAAFMRARVLSQAKRSSRLRPQGVWQWAAVVCLGFFVSTAMAQVIRVQLPRVIEALRREPAAEEPQKKPARSATPKAATPVEANKPVEPEPAAPSGAEEPAALSGAEGPAAQRGVAERAAQPGAPGGSAEQGPAAQRGVAEAPARRGVVASRPATRPATASSTRGPRAAAKRTLSAQPTVTPPLAAELDDEAAQPAEPATAAPSPNTPEPEAATASSKPKPPAPEPAELALFRRAQSLHLAHDPRAIAAWDAFLRAAPSSALAPEARYNRALGLVRAHKYADARRALQPFAAGAYGSYRKQEAQQLLERLPK
jgi:hypothetical protein